MPRLLKAAVVARIAATKTAAARTRRSKGTASAAEVQRPAALRLVGTRPGVPTRQHGALLCL